MAGMGMLSMVKGETAQVLAGTGGVCAVGAFIFGLYSASSASHSPAPAPARTPRRSSSVLLGAVSSKLPGTFSPQWKMATAKYRAAMNQDPITNSS